MAHRHQVHKARGGFVKGETGAKGKAYTGKGSNVEHEAESEKEGFRRGGRKHHDAKAHGGKSKKRADHYARGGRAKGGSPLSSAAGGIKGQKGFAAPVMSEHGGHGEKMDHEAHGGGVEGKKHRTGHHGKAKHQFAEGGRTKEEGCDDGEEEDGHAVGGRAPPLMHYRGGKGRKKAGGGHVDVYETHGGTHHWSDDDHSRAKGGRSSKWIQGAIKHPGALHKSLGVPEGEKIPAKKLNKAEHSDSPKLARRAALAKTLKGLHH